MQAGCEPACIGVAITRQNYARLFTRVERPVVLEETTK
jgi:hypothetical protein